ncbi:hypothetical protein CWI42_021140 [Ordospora colligata]|uniref:Uncharacterized protein n=1 Tax=Ordospora colligata OC4 TaxID=1354746 RepID=A0A0B2UML8_9MICR|nr:uncharacterized protein M896_021150 [Ordospora colligata OC4]KHN70277.1 hypothetical protein M896_021150 [Ordospora colligata OC4]TBU16821.1 hypothetical protein CWI41_021160 [Ordospora colligata]TBU16929.1 hypothetical protein CWI40_021160 [Ordospora colligata]TBU19370.1 hypothetical protein CWI42_021140 [Ordospora colligata]
MLSEVLSEIELHLNQIENSGSVCKENIVAIEDAVQLCDKLIESCQQPSRLLRQYSFLINRYRTIMPYRELDIEISACEAHIESIARQNSMVRLEQGIYEIISIADYIDHTVQDARLTIDNIAQYLEDAERYTAMAGQEMNAVMSRKRWKVKAIRYIISFVFTFLAILLFIKVAF